MQPHRIIKCAKITGRLFGIGCFELARMRKISDVAAQAVVCWQHGVGKAQAGGHAQARHQALRRQVGVAGVGGECRQAQVV